MHLCVGTTGGPGCLLATWDWKRHRIDAEHCRRLLVHWQPNRIVLRVLIHGRDTMAAQCVGSRGIPGASHPMNVPDPRRLNDRPAEQVIARMPPAGPGGEQPVPPRDLSLYLPSFCP